MSDPLSVAASIAGLLAVTAKISKILIEYGKGVKDAPVEWQRFQEEVDDVRGVLGQLQDFVLGSIRPTRARTSLIMVEQVVTVLAGTVTTFSELDTVVGILEDVQNRNLSSISRWVWDHKQIQDIYSRLQTHKLSLTLMLTILTCQQQREAEDKVDRLCELVETTLQQNEFLVQRLAKTDDDQTTIRSEMTTIQTDQNIDRAAQNFAFETALKSSRPYRRINFADDTFSISILSSAGRTGSWSALSGLSLSEISAISVVALPIYKEDLENQDAYNFEPPMSPDKKRLLEKVTYATVLNYFHSERQDELEVHTGECIIVVARSNDEWIVAKPIGRIGGPGLVPISFLEFKDMKTGLTVADPHQALEDAGIPWTEEWVAAAGAIKANAKDVGTKDLNGDLPADRRWRWSRPKQ